MSGAPRENIFDDFAYFETALSDPESTGKSMTCTWMMLGWLRVVEQDNFRLAKSLSEARLSYMRDLESRVLARLEELENEETERERVEGKTR